MINKIYALVFLLVITPITIKSAEMHGDLARLKKNAWEMAATGAMFPLNMAVHESGHAIGAILTGATVDYMELGRKDLCKWPIEMKRLRIYPGSMAVAARVGLDSEELYERWQQGRLTEFGFKSRMAIHAISGPLVGLAFSHQVLKAAIPDEHPMRYLTHALILASWPSIHTVPRLVLGAVVLKKVDDVVAKVVRDGLDTKSVLDGLQKPLVNDNDHGLIAIGATWGLVGNYLNLAPIIPGTDGSHFLEEIDASKKVVKSVRIVYGGIGLFALGAGLIALPLVEKVADYCTLKMRSKIAAMSKGEIEK